MPGFASKIRTAANMPFADWGMFFEAGLQLVAAAILVRSWPKRRWTQNPLQSASDRIDPREISTETKATVDRVRRAIARFSQIAPAIFICLPQAVAARRMLKRRGIKSALYCGTRQGGSGEMEFHAWLKVGEKWVVGHCDENSYAVFVPGNGDG